MEVKYDSSQDITLILENEETKALKKCPTKHFSEIHTSSKTKNQDGSYYILLKGLCKELGAFFLLGYSKDLEGIFKNATDMEGFGKIIIPESEVYPWNINLSKRGYEHLQKGWPDGIRYNGSNKLFIKKEEEI